MECEHHDSRRRLPEPNPKPDRIAGDTEPNAVVPAGHHAIEHTDDHTAQLGLVQ
jgi:hypothetical protein